MGQRRYNQPDRATSKHLAKASLKGTKQKLCKESSAFGNFNLLSYSLSRANKWSNLRELPIVFQESQFTHVYCIICTRILF